MPRTQAKKRDRSNTFLLHMQPDEPAMLRRIAESMSAELGVPVSQTAAIRRWIRGEFSRLEKISRKSRSGH